LERYDGKLHEERNKSEFGDKLVHDGKVVTARHSLVCMMELPTIT